MPNRAGSAPRHSSLAERQRAADEKALHNAVKIRELKAALAAAKAAASATRTAKGGARKRATRRRSTRRH